MSQVEKYRIQRQHREKERKQYLAKLQRIRGNTKSPTSNSGSFSQQLGVPISEPLVQEQQEIIKQNKKLNEQLLKLQEQCGIELVSHRQKLIEIQQKYFVEINKINETAQTERKQIEARLNQMIANIKAAMNESNRIQESNAVLEQQLKINDENIEAMVQHKRKQYEDMLQQFAWMLQASTESNELIEDQQENFENEKIISFIQKARRNQQKIDHLLQQHMAVLKNGALVSQQVNQAVETKWRDLQKMRQLHTKMVSIVEIVHEEIKRLRVKNEQNRQQFLRSFSQNQLKILLASEQT